MSHSKPLLITLGNAAANRRNKREEQMRCLARIHGHLSSNCSRGLPALPNMRGKRRPTMQHDKIIRPYLSKCHPLMAKTETWRWLEVRLSDRAIFYGNCSFFAVDVSTPPDDVEMPEESFHESTETEGAGGG